MKYYPVVKNWRKIKPHLADDELNRILIRDFNKFTYGINKERFVKGMLPCEVDGGDWRLFRKGRPPEYHKYVKHAACHWIVNFLLRLARLVEPDRDWVIITYDAHSTVWDKKDTLFDFNFLAFGVSADDCYKASNSRMVKNYMRIYYAQPYIDEHLLIPTLKSNLAL